MSRPLLSMKYARWVDAHLLQRMQLSSVTTHGTGVSSTSHVRSAASTQDSTPGQTITRTRPPILPPQQSSANPGAYKAPAVRVPPMESLLKLNDQWGLQLNEDEVRALQSCMCNAVLSYQRVDELVERVPPVAYPRTPGHRPQQQDNPYNAWYYKTDITGASEGVLSGRTVAVKDSICVAGVPMMNGSRILEGFIPDIDATVVTRVLDAGGVIAGKAVCEDLCCSGSSFATALGPVRNPYHEDYAAGGSSSGCAALVAGNVVDLAIGADQGGSIRIPASWCGIVGLKPTYGLVPYTGSSSHELTVDHLGPMARTVMEAAELLEVLAGYDGGMDPRQPPNMGPLPQYSKMVTGDVRGLRVGVVQEGLANCEPDVVEACHRAADALQSAGAHITHLSIPMHADSASIWLPLCLEGGHLTRMDGGGVGVGYKGYYPSSILQAYDRGFRTHPADLSYTNKFYILFGEYVRANYGKRYYAKCQNLATTLTQQYDTALSSCDVLLLPTLPLKPIKMLHPDASPAEFIAQAWCMLQNSAGFDLSGHPALSVNAAFSQGGEAPLPIGVQVVGRRWEDGTVLNAAHAIETLLFDRD